jgi:hypothetical protein
MYAVRISIHRAEAFAENATKQLACLALGLALFIEYLK